MNIYLLLGFVLLVYVCSVFVLSVFLKRNDIADVAWGLGFCLISWFSFNLSDGLVDELFELTGQSFTSDYDVAKDVLNHIKQKNVENLTKIFDFDFRFS